MGAAVSVAVAKMPDYLDEATLKKICGPKFDKKKFDSLKGADGYLSKTDLLEELAKPDYEVKTTVKVRALRSTFDQLLSQNLSTSQKAKFITKPSFRAPGATTDDGESDEQPTDTDVSNIHTDGDGETPVNANLESSNRSDVPQIDATLEVDGIVPDHIGHSSEKSTEEDDEWRQMTEPQRSQRAARAMADLARGVMEEAILNEHTPTNTTTNGIGVYRWDDNGQYYAGDWKDGKQNGNGVMRFPNGGVYEGEWKDGKMNGMGIYRGVDGDLYEGECLDDKRFGFGVFRFPDGKTYEGEWVKDKVHGGGILRAPDGTLIED